MKTRMITTLALVAAFAPATLFGQIAAPPRVGPVPSEGNEGLRKNALGTSEQVAVPNRIVEPIPLTTAEKDVALKGIDNHLATDIAELKEALLKVLPDEISMLAKTAQWKPADQQTLVTAVRAQDSAAVYEAWTKAAPQDTANAEIAARQTDARKIIGRLTQDVEKNPSALRQDVADLDSALSKIAATTPGVSDLGPAVANISSWIEARRYVEAADPAKGAVAMMPQGKMWDPLESTCRHASLSIL